MCDKFEEITRISTNTVRILSADRDVASFRLVIEKYLATGDAAALKHAREHAREHATQAAQTLSEVGAATRSVERRQVIERLQQLVGALAERFEQAVQVRDRKIALVVEADALGAKVRDAIDGFDRGVVPAAGLYTPLENLMRSRLDLAGIAGAYVEDRAREGVALATTSAKQIREAAAGYPPDRRARALEIANLADGYSARLTEAVTTIVELRQLTGEVMDAIGKQISETSKTLRGLQGARQSEIEAELNAYGDTAEFTIGALTVVALVVGIVFALVISRMVSRPIVEMAAAARVAEEIGELIRLAAHDGDFRNRTPAEGRAGFVGTISVAVNRLFDSVCEALGAIGGDAARVAVAAADASGAVVEVNAGAAEQAGSLEQVHEAIRATAEGITRVSANTGIASEAAERATTLVGRGRILVEQLVALMQTIENNGREVSQVTHALGQIATKTDILATTVAVEAARLGDDGRSFAVIGQQIGALAEHAGTSAARIAALADTANRDVQAGLTAATGVRQAIDDIHAQVAATDALIRQIAEAMLAQQSAIIEIDATADSLARIGEHNVAAGEQISRRLVELEALSQATRTAVARFRIDQRFLAATASAG